ncbi:MAG: MBL fold metallo-hydrolase [Candidatus Eisenbacteria bacterium]|uniref:MBL fold metallo-hydrolase n=1 Tax=Eiseniibacteriota bacterium TaxID=2212470 RepID=A0A7Y2E578_UNCEI|nr:MBL fold metallo-hydrolase [Candidatus Eisenbacteria bacterium]
MGRTKNEQVGLDYWSLLRYFVFGPTRHTTIGVAMLLDVFNVDHGACALMTSSNGRRIMVDCGHHSETQWFPGNALNDREIFDLDRLIVSHFDEDHCSGIGNLLTKVHVHQLVFNGSTPSEIVRQMKAKQGMRQGTETLVRALEQTFTIPVSLHSDAYEFGDMSWSTFQNRYEPPYGFTDSNNLSLVTFVRCGPHKIIFPGDLEVAGWKQLLRNRAFVNELQGVTIFMASHHGRLNGYCEDVMDLCPQLDVVIFTDEGIRFDTQRTAALYRQHVSRGIFFAGKHRRVLTTRTDKSMRFELRAEGGGQVALNIAA